jgi:ADP-ribosylglycohydrolase
LAEGLSGNSRRYFPYDDVAGMYVRWYASNPFDMGSTCRTAFGNTWWKYKEHGETNLGEHMKKAAENSVISEANGALMRVIPLAIWASSLCIEKVADMAAKDAMLSHPSQVCQDCNRLYCIAVSSLIKYPHDIHKALKVTEDYARANTTTIVKEWLLEQSHNVDHLDCTINIGHVKYGFILAFYHLRKQSSFETAIRETLMKGGDTDTNAAIVGGLLGAYHGYESIPSYMKNPVMEFDCTKKHKDGYVRNEFFKPSNCLRYVESLMLR